MRGNKRVLVAMSGGVDSSLAAIILKRRGYETLGATMELWPKGRSPQDCNANAYCSTGGIEDARYVCQKLDIPHYVFDFQKEFKDRVIEYFCNEYADGFTPNPCIVCNQKLKFTLFLNKAIELDCAYIATGHYAKVGYSKLSRRYFIGEGEDKEKDQSYFLSFLSQTALSRTVFPLSNMTKAESRHLAKDLQLRTHDKRSSQEVCFVKGRYADYVRNHANVIYKEGDILNTKGEKIGRHKGIHHYTIGQRKGLGIACKEPLYVTKIDKDKNAVIAGTKKELEKSTFTVKDPCWYLVKDIERPTRVMCKIRYAHKKADAVIEKIEDGKLKVSFLQPQIAPTPGQAAVFYKNDKILGAGWIKTVLE